MYYAMSYWMSSRALGSTRRWGSWVGVLGLAAAVAVSPRVSAIEPSGDADAGREVYAANCAMCHGADAAGMMGMHPGLRGAVERLTVEGVEVAIRNGRQTMPPMPAFGARLSDEEIADVIAYLATLPPGPRNFGPEMGRDGMMGDGGMMDGMMGGGWAGPVVALVLALLLVVVAGLVVALVMNRRGRPDRDRGWPGGESPRDLIDRRYAAGELSAEEYRQAREDLEG